MGRWLLTTRQGTSLGELEHSLSALGFARVVEMAPVPMDDGSIVVSVDAPDSARHALASIPQVAAVHVDRPMKLF